MSVTITDIPFEIKEKNISLQELLSKYVVFLQDQENIETIKDDLKSKNSSKFSLDEIRELYV